MCDQCIKEITGVETVDGEGKDEELFDDDGNPIEDE
jgi:hypothetical protein